MRNKNQHHWRNGSVQIIKTKSAAKKWWGGFGWRSLCSLSCSTRDCSACTCAIDQIPIVGRQQLLVALKLPRHHRGPRFSRSKMTWRVLSREFHRESLVSRPSSKILRHGSPPGRAQQRSLLPLTPRSRDSPRRSTRGPLRDPLNGQEQVGDNLDSNLHSFPSTPASIPAWGPSEAARGGSPRKVRRPCRGRHSRRRWTPVRLSEEDACRRQFAVEP